METQSEIDNAEEVVMPPSSHWSKRAIEIRALAAKAKSLEIRVILEDIARLYELLAHRLN